MMDDESNNGPKVVDLPKQKNELQALGEEMSRNLHVFIANQQTLAKIRRAAYLAYVKEGFTEAQALELCCK